MVTILHVVLALLSLGLATYNVFKPLQNRLKMSYRLAGATLVSGVSLIFINNASVLRTCLSGIVFFMVVVALNTISVRRLATEQ